MRLTTLALTVGAATVVAASGCVTTRQLAALKQVRFAIDTLVNVRLAGVDLDRVRSVNDLGPLDAARLAGAAMREDVPLSFTILVRGTNPESNRVTARMLRLTWTLKLNGRETVSGAIDTAYVFPPGVPTEVSVPVALNLYTFFRTSGRDAFQLALGLLGGPSRPTDVALTATPIIDTPLGAITYPHAITIVRRTVGGAPGKP